jgi:hypothetical protein
MAHGMSTQGGFLCYAGNGETMPILLLIFVSSQCSFYCTVSSWFQIFFAATRSHLRGVLANKKNLAVAKRNNNITFFFAQQQQQQNRTFPPISGGVFRAEIS